MVIESNPSVGQSSNKRAIGGVRATHSDPAKIALCLRSIKILSTWKETYGDDIEWQTGGYCFIAYREEDERTLKTLLKTQKEFGLNIDWYDKDELWKHVPDLNPENLIGGTISPDDGNCSPLLTNHAFYRQAVHAGVSFVFDQKVSQLIIDNDKVIGIQTNKDTYYCNTVINAAGAWAKEIAALGGMNIPVNPDSHEAAITEAVAPFLKPMIVDIRPTAGSANYYFYQHRTGQIVFCITPDPTYGDLIPGRQVPSCQWFRKE